MEFHDSQTTVTLRLCPTCRTSFADDDGLTVTDPRTTDGGTTIQPALATGLRRCPDCDRLYNSSVNAGCPACLVETLPSSDRRP